MEIIRCLIPLGLMEISDELDQELEELTGRKYSLEEEKEGNVWYRSNSGSVYLDGQKALFNVPSVRNLLKDEEVALEDYQAFHNNKEISEILLQRVFRVFLVETMGLRQRPSPELLVYLHRLYSGNLSRQATLN